MNKELALGMVVFATTVWAQDNLSGQMQAGCGPDQAKFEVRRQAHSHPTAIRNPARHWCMYLEIRNWKTRRSVLEA
jgi:hypothetical protein